MRKIAIVGGGVIGLLSAYELRRRGHDVIVFDKGEPGLGASAGNAGWVTPSLSGPVPSPSVMVDSMRWMLKPDSPLYIRPGAVPRMLGWVLSFWRHCTQQAYEAGFRALAHLNKRTMQDFDALVAAGLDFEMHAAGLLFVGLQPQTLDRLMKDFLDLEKLGLGTPVRYTSSEAQELEPALRPDIAGAVWMPEERHVRPESLISATLDWLRQNGVDIRSHTEVTALASEGGRITGVRTPAGVIDADQVLIATGAEAAALARQAGFRLPMQAGKGYSITIRNPQLRIGRPMYLEEARIALSPFRDGLRVAGTMELSGVNLHLDMRRVEAIRRGAHRYLHDWESGDETVTWVGMRPMLPDGLPAIGRAPGHDNLFVASGHAMLGVTLGPTTAAAIAAVMNNEPFDVDLKPFDPGRF